MTPSPNTVRPEEEDYPASRFLNEFEILILKSSKATDIEQTRYRELKDDILALMNRGMRND